MRSQSCVIDIIGNVMSQLNCAALLTRKMLGKLFAAVNEPELMLIALHVMTPEVAAYIASINCTSELKNKGFSADGQTSSKRRKKCKNKWSPPSHHTFTLVVE